MFITIQSDPLCVQHETGEHPESPERWAQVDRALRALAAEVPGRLQFETPEPASDAVLELVHPASHLARLASFCAAGGGRIDEDTVATPLSEVVARRSAGAAIAAVQAALRGPERRHVALCRPPGHHALPEATMGFCFYNNAALAARWAQRHGGLQRVAILDWDLHHGNGTEAIFWEDPTVLYMSTHQDPNWPGTGASSDVGEGPGRGFTANLPLPIGTGDDGYRKAFAAVFRPLMAHFRPELLIVSAGYDAHWRDPLGRMGLTVSGFAELTREVLQWADGSAAGRCVFLMEGGYDLMALRESMGASVAVLLEAPVHDRLGASPYPEPALAVELAIRRTQEALRPYWPGLFSGEASQ
ncbi:MAG: histone deacetylase [Candidatus Sericytochromatia bacterium]|nr:histone deacetylase [Candidatus Sericytochromatia bacterium]